jgi:hypothetical protein
MALGSTQPLREMSTRNLSGGKGRPACGADNLTDICERIGYKMWEPRRLTTLWASTACYRDSFTFFLPHFIKQNPHLLPSREFVVRQYNVQELLNISTNFECNKI